MRSRLTWLLIAAASAIRWEAGTSAVLRARGAARIGGPPLLAATEVSKAVRTAAPSTQWELDFYSRPVQGPDGKKLWELLVTDDAGSFKHAEAVPSNCVNSRELRTRVQRLVDGADVKPENIRFFRKQMKNMISIALGDLPEVRCVPSRATYQLYSWLEEREREVYPGMSGYRAPRPEAPGIKLPVRLPEQLRGEKYAFVTLPYAEFAEGAINAENIGFGALCPLPRTGLPADALVHGLVIFSKRSAAIAAWLTGIDLVFVKARAAPPATTLLAPLERRPRAASCLLAPRRGACHIPAAALTRCRAHLPPAGVARESRGAARGGARHPVSARAHKGPAAGARGAALRGGQGEHRGPPLPLDPERPRSGRARWLLVVERLRELWTGLMWPGAAGGQGRSAWVGGVASPPCAMQGGSGRVFECSATPQATRRLCVPSERIAV